MFVVAVLALVAAASPAGAGGRVKPVRVAAPVQSDDSVVADGSSKLLLAHPSFGGDPGSLTRINLNGSLDRSFGDEGTVTIDAEGAAVTPDGKILVATASEPGESAAQSDARVTCLLPDGSPDPSFGQGGSTDVHFGRRYDYGEAVSLAPNGDILLAGIRVDYASEYGGEDTLAVARLKPDGALDRSFGKNGVSTLFSHGEEEEAFDVASTPSGGVVVAGGNEIYASVWGLNRDGSVDRHFGDRGIVGMPLDRKTDGRSETLLFAPEIAETRSGGLLLAATGSSRMVTVRLRSDGRIDRSYGHHGWTVVKGASAEGLTLLPGGDLAVAGSFEGKVAKGHGQFGVIALRPDGRLDRRFGRRGFCGARLAGRHEAVGVTIVGGRAAVVGSGNPGDWLLECLPPVGVRGRASAASRYVPEPWSGDAGTCGNASGRSGHSGQPAVA